ncbi:MAG: PAS domain-containing protein [Gemmatimonadales bacterium]|nr:PAS domain-containing protein [Gemmatimonadales bacterium]
MARSKSPRRARAEDLSSLDRRVAELQQERRDEAEQVTRFRAALRGSRVGMFNQDRELRYTWVYNPHAGFSSADVLGKTDEDLLPPPDAAALTALKRRVLKAGAGESAEVTVTIDGRAVCYDLHVEPMREGSGEISGVMGVAVDITERKRFETAVKEGEERHRALLWAVPDMIFRLRRDGTFLEYVPGHDITPLMSPDEFLGRRMEDLLPGSITEPSMRALERAFVSGEAQTFEYPLEIDQETRHFEARIAVSGQEEALVIVRDITENRRALEALQRRDRQLGLLLAAAIRLNSQLSVDTVLQEVADSARAVIGCRYAALGILSTNRTNLDTFVTSGIDSDHAARIGAPPTGKGVLGRVMAEQRPIRMGDLTADPKAHGFPPEHPPMRSFLGVPVIGRYGPIGNLYFTEKISAAEFTAEDEALAQMLAAEAAVAVENSRLITELQSMHASRDRFYAMVNHELRNALTGVYGWAELLMRKTGPQPPREVYETVECAEYAMEIVNDMLDLSRLDAAKLKPRVSEVDAMDIVAHSLTTVQPEAHRDGVVIAVEGGDQPLTCRTDATRVQQVLINLLRNAIRHSGGTEVIVRLEADATEMRFAVVDQGKGIDPAQQAVLFDAYERADSAKGGGTGLGLTLSRRLARLLGGEIQVDSELNKGATFTLRIARYMKGE